MVNRNMAQASVAKRKMATVARGNRKAMAPAKAASSMKRLSGLSKVQAKEVVSRMPKGKMYAGGSKDFDERTGTYRSTGTKRSPKVPKNLERMPRIKTRGK